MVKFPLAVEVILPLIRTPLFLFLLLQRVRWELPPILISLLTLISLLAVILTKEPLANIFSSVEFVSVVFVLLFRFGVSALSPVPVYSSFSKLVSLRPASPALIYTFSGSNNHSLASTIALSLMNKSCPDVSTKPPVLAISPLP
nr:hypothetical protein BV200_01435 [Haemophilus influenzae]